MAKETYYFPHDYEPTSDPKIQALLSEYGAAGYGLYWRIVEMLHSDADHRIPTRKYIMIAIAKQMQSNTDFLQKFIDDCVNIFELFTQDHDMIFCDRVFRNVQNREQKTNTAKANAKARWDAVALQKNAGAMQSDANKGNKRILKESKGNKRKEFVAPSAKNVQDYFLEKGYSDMSGLKAFNYYNDADWKDSQGKPVKNWKQKMQGVWFKPENLLKPTTPVRVLTEKDFYSESEYLHYCKEKNITPQLSKASQ